MKDTINNIIKHLNREMPIAGTEEAKKDVDECYRRILNKQLSGNENIIKALFVLASGLECAYGACFPLLKDNNFSEQLEDLLK